MGKHLKKYYRAYKLVKVSEPKAPPYKKGKKNFIVHKTNGVCRLELLVEAETLDEIYSQLIPERFYYNNEDRILEKFIFDVEYEISSLDVRSSGKTVYYPVGRTSWKGSENVFQYIYETYDKDIIFVIDSWDVMQIEKMLISFHKYKEGLESLFYSIELLH